VTEEGIRPKAVCVCRRGGEILVGEAYDAVKGETFYGPPGGGVEFGERAADAVRRELREELGVELDDVVLLGVMENLFTYEGRPGHEITFVFEARLRDPALYACDEIVGIEGKHPCVVRWLPLDHFGPGGPGGPPLYPEGLLELLLARFDRGHP
jgi:ADP-ribose pyrophosphatase YjhB (NUDIX family)